MGFWKSWTPRSSDMIVFTTLLAHIAPTVLAAPVAYDDGSWSPTKYPGGEAAAPIAVPSVVSQATPTVLASTPAAATTVVVSSAAVAASSVAPSSAPAPSSAAPASTASSTPQGNTDFAAAIAKIAPATTSCPSGGANAAECATNAVAGPAIASAFTKYQITNAHEQAALIALMMFETGDFVYDKSHYPEPGIPGKGTRNLQSPDFNKKYATDVLGADKISGKSPADILDMLTADKVTDFGSAAWFLTTQCQTGVRTQLQTGSEAGFNAHLACVGTTDPNGQRKTKWLAAKAALGAA